MALGNYFQLFPVPVGGIGFIFWEGGINIKMEDFIVLLLFFFFSRQTDFYNKRQDSVPYTTPIILMLVHFSYLYLATLLTYVLTYFLTCLQAIFKLCTCVP